MKPYLKVSIKLTEVIDLFLKLFCLQCDFHVLNM